MQSIKVSHIANISMVYYLTSILEKPIDIQFHRLGDDITKRNNELTGKNSIGFRYKKFTYNEGYQSALHPSLHQEAKDMEQWILEMQRQIKLIQPLLYALSLENIGKQTINYFIPNAAVNISEVSDTLYKTQVAKLEEEYPTEIVALNILKIGALLV